MKILLCKGVMVRKIYLIIFFRLWSKKINFLIWFDAQWSNFKRAQHGIFLWCTFFITPMVGHSKTILTFVVLCMVLMHSGKKAQNMVKNYQTPVTHPNWFLDKQCPSCDHAWPKEWGIYIFCTFVAFLLSTRAAWSFQIFRVGLLNKVHFLAT